MSYLFNVKAASKAAAKDAVAVEFDKVVAAQPIHARDRAAMLANASTVIDLLADDDTKDVSVSCSGSVSWTGTGDVAVDPLSAASVSSNAYHSTRE